MTNPYLESVVGQTREWDDARPRSQQKAMGWSDISGCRAYMGYEFRGEWATNDVDTWRAMVGTTLHDWLRPIRKRALQIAGVAASWEVEVEYGGIPGHADEVIWGREVTDWKFPSLASSKTWDDPEVLDERFVQPMGYAAGVVDLPEWQQAAPGDPEDFTVRILCAPVDGTTDDWFVFERPFDRDVADKALKRYLDTVELASIGEPLPKDKPWHFCERYCEFFSLCREGGQPRELPEITDPEYAAAIERYGVANEMESAALKVKRELAPLVRGLRGRARGFKVSMTRPGAGGIGLDEARINADYSARGWDLPYVPKPGRPPSLRVVRDKKDDS